MPKLKDITGQKFGHLYVIGRDYSKKENVTYWLCKCDCGNEKIISVAKNSLTSGRSTSCGCARSKTKKEKPNRYDLSGDFGVGWTSNTNHIFYFDLEDFDKIKYYCWYENDNGYIVTQRGRKTIRMHRLIMNVNNSKVQIDHIYHRKYDNRKKFLRLATNTQNSQNKKCRGIYYSTEKNKYVACITYYGKKIFKYFNNEADALKYRKKLEAKYYKEFAYKEQEGEYAFMINPKQYFLSDDITEEKLVKAGFSIKTNSYLYTKNLYRDYVSLNLSVNKTPPYFISENIICDDGSIYHPFYNHMGENLVCDQVTEKYNQYIDELISLGVLKPVENYFPSQGIFSEEPIAIKIKYTSSKLKKLENIEGKSDWIDLRAAETVHLSAGEFKLISLGVAMVLPEGYEAHIVPRSSTFKNYGIIQTNHMGVIDNSYCGDNDIWKFPAYAIRDTDIKFNDRICQFRIVKKQPEIEFKEVKELGNSDRGGFGSTGKN